jgi:hypothetical protein
LREEQLSESSLDSKDRVLEKWLITRITMVGEEDRVSWVGKMSPHLCREKSYQLGGHG